MTDPSVPAFRLTGATTFALPVGVDDTEHPCVIEIHACGCLGLPNPTMTVERYRSLNDTDRQRVDEWLDSLGFGDNDDITAYSTDENEVLVETYVTDADGRRLLHTGGDVHAMTNVITARARR